MYQYPYPSGPQYSCLGPSRYWLVLPGTGMSPRAYLWQIEAPKKVLGITFSFWSVHVCCCSEVYPSSFSNNTKSAHSTLPLSFNPFSPCWPKHTDSSQHHGDLWPWSCDTPHTTWLLSSHVTCYANNQGVPEQTTCPWNMLKLELKSQGIRCGSKLLANIPLSH